MELPIEKRRLRITCEALRRAHTYAQLVNQHVGDGYECIGFLLGETGCDVVDSVMLAPGQQVTPASVRINGQNVLAAGREIERLGKTVIGWWHSHGNLQNFHSGTDDNNTRDVLLQVAFSNHLDLQEELFPQATDDHGAILSFVDGSACIEIFGEHVIAQQLLEARIRVRRRSAVGFAYSLVVNVRGDESHAELYTRQWCPSCQKNEYGRLVVPVEIVPSADDERMVEEVKAKVMPAHRSPVAAPALPALLKPIGNAMNSARSFFSPRKEGSA
jgi:proteasome lid subunit RPN8/RPN11